MPKGIDLTPTFETAVRICILALTNGTAEGKRAATEELLRYGRSLDRCAGFVNTVASMTKDGEPIDYGQEREPYQQREDDAVDALHSLIDKARDIQAKGGK